MQIGIFLLICCQCDVIVNKCFLIVRQRVIDFSCGINEFLALICQGNSADLVDCCDNRISGDMVSHSLFSGGQLCEGCFCYLACLIGRNKCIVCGSCCINSRFVSGGNVSGIRECVDLICHSLSCLCIVNILDGSLCGRNGIVHIGDRLCDFCLGHIIIRINSVCSGDSIGESRNRCRIICIVLDCVIISVRRCNCIVQSSLFNRNNGHGQVILNSVVVIGIGGCIGRSKSVIANIAHA